MSATQETSSIIGKGRSRIDGPLKVSGKATYTSDHNFPGMLYAFPVIATISSGKLNAIDSIAAEKMPGVRAVYQRSNIGKLFKVALNHDFSSYTTILDENRPPFHDDTIRYYGQYIAVVVANTFEQARAAASKVQAYFTPDQHDVSPKLLADRKGDKTKAPTTAESSNVESERGDAERAFSTAQVKIDATYHLPPETHVPIELHATVAKIIGTLDGTYDVPMIGCSGSLVIPQSQIKYQGYIFGSGLCAAGHESTAGSFRIFLLLNSGGALLVDLDPGGPADVGGDRLFDAAIPSSSDCTRAFSVNNLLTSSTGCGTFAFTSSVGAQNGTATITPI